MENNHNTEMVMIYIEVIARLQKLFDISDDTVDSAFDHAEQEVAKKTGRTLH